MDRTQQRIRAAVQRQASALVGLARWIHRHPETGFQERGACERQVRLLRRWGFRVENPFVDLPTAYRAVTGKGRPVFCLMAEYDALPDIGHACGHNLIAAAALGAGRALAEVMRAERCPGTLIVMGTPAEESRGGKVLMIRRGALRGVDAALMAHPSYRTVPDSGCSGITRFDVTFRGKAAHAAAMPERGLNALDAVMLVFHGINAWRQQLPESSRVHGIVTDGGVAPNIIPERAACSFFLRSPSDAVLAGMVARFRDIVRGAALMTGTRAAIAQGELPYKARRPNGALNEAFVEAAEAAGLAVVHNPLPGRASTDFGDVSHRVPGSHVYFGICRKQTALHSVAFRAAAASDYGERQMLRAAEALAVAGWRYVSDRAFRDRVRVAFTQRR